jgi:hypothetical protein
MTLLRRIKDALGFGPKLRNKPGGMAWIKPLGGGYGADVMAGRAVKTVSLLDGKFWTIDPPQEYVITGTRPVQHPNGIVSRPGDRVRSVAIVDECLEPWKEDGVTASEVRTLYTPKLVKDKETTV